MYNALDPRLRTDASREQMFCLTSHGLWLNLYHHKAGRQRSTESTVGFDVREGIKSMAPTSTCPVSCFYKLSSVGPLQWMMTDQKKLLHQEKAAVMISDYRSVCILTTYWNKENMASKLICKPKHIYT